MKLQGHYLYGLCVSLTILSTITTIIIGFLQVFSSRSGYILDYEFPSGASPISDHISAQLNRIAPDTEAYTVSISGGPYAFEYLHRLYYRRALSLAFGNQPGRGIQGWEWPQRDPRADFSLASYILERGFELEDRPDGDRAAWEVFSAPHVVVRVRRRGVGNETVSDEAGRVARAVTDRVDGYLGVWAARDALSTAAPFVALCVGIGFAVLQVPGMVFVMLERGRGKVVSHGLLVAICLASAISFTVSGGTIATLIRDRIVDRDIFDDMIPRAVLTTTTSPRFIGFTVVMAVLSSVGFVMAAGMTAIGYLKDKASKSREIGKEAVESS